MFKLFSCLRVALAITFSGLLLAPLAHAAPKAWQISEVTGEVTLESEGVALAAERGATLKGGDTVTTGTGGRAVVVRGGEYVIVSPKSRIRIAQPDEADQKTQIFQSLGSALFKVEKKESWDFGVKTPYLAAVVKGTTFNVTVTDAGSTVQVTEGKVEVSTLDGGASDLIVPGRIARVDAAEMLALKVLGTDEKVIRSPAASEAQSGFKAGTPDAPAADASAGGSVEIGVVGQTVGAGAAGASDFGFLQGNGQGGFSGQVESAVGGGPASVSAATNGLIGGNQSLDQLLSQAADAAVVGNGNGQGLGLGGGPVDPGAGSGLGLGAGGAGNSGGPVDPGAGSGLGLGAGGAGNSGGPVDPGAGAGSGLGAGGAGNSGGFSPQ
jgi:FecR protein